MRSQSSEEYPGFFWGLLLVAVIALCVAVLTSCHTYTEITEAPEVFWVTLEKIFLALLEDAWAILKAL